MRVFPEMLVGVAWNRTTRQRRPVLSALACFLVAVFIGQSFDAEAQFRRRRQAAEEAPKEAAEAPAPPPGESVAAPSGKQGSLEVDLTTVLGQHIPGRVDLMPMGEGSVHRLEVPEGRLEASVPVGEYRAYIYAYEEGVPILVEIQNISVTEGGMAFVLLNLLEGAVGSLNLRDFDSDGDLAIDRVEIEAGTDPYNAASVPGRAVLPFDTTVLSPEGKWFRGDLYAHSKYGRGSESVSELIRRAERTGLDFLAITDRNTMASVHDEGYKSDKLVLIPAMEWGTEERGFALIYGPRTMPDMPSTVPAAQMECIRVQAQGGVFAIAHPCFPTAPWQWGLSYVNAVQVWARGWRDVPPMGLQQLGDVYQERTQLTAEQIAQGRRPQLIHSIAAAAAESNLAPVSANMQSTKFWDYELARGLMAAPIAGSSSATPRIPLGAPVTYIRAQNKSLPAIMEGFRQGHVYVSSGLDGPQLYFRADVLGNGKMDVDIGGVVPLNMLVIFEVGVMKAKGLKLEVLKNGRPILTKVIEGDAFVAAFEQKPSSNANYRVRIIGPPKNPRSGFGPLEMHAMSGPIYAQNITAELIAQYPNLQLEDSWVRVNPPEMGEVRLPEGDAPMRLNTLN